METSKDTSLKTGIEAKTEVAADTSAAKADKGGDVFAQLFTRLGDHHVIAFEPIGDLPLPYLFWDQDGFHYFASEHAVEESHTYKVDDKGKPSREDGKPLSLDMSITANVAFMMLAAVILLIVARLAAMKTKNQLVPKGIRNLVEVFVVYIRDEIVNPNVEAPHNEKLLPYFLSIFCFILIMNLLGMVPYGHSATGSVSVTAALAICTFLVTQLTGLRALGFVGFLKHLTGGLIDMDLAPAIKYPLMLIMIPIEVIGLFTKPFALAIRLFANMTAGHIIIISLIGLAFFFKSLLVGAFVSVPFSLFISMLELLVAFLQAYVFTMLSAVFIGFMSHGHEEHEEGSEHAEAAHH